MGLVLLMCERRTPIRFAEEDPASKTASQSRLDNNIHLIGDIATSVYATIFIAEERSGRLIAACTGRVTFRGREQE